VANYFSKHEISLRRYHHLHTSPLLLFLLLRTNLLRTFKDKLQTYHLSHKLIIIIRMQAVTGSYTKLIKLFIMCKNINII